MLIQFNFEIKSRLFNIKKMSSLLKNSVESHNEFLNLLLQPKDVINIPRRGSENVNGPEQSLPN